MKKVQPVQGVMIAGKFFPQAIQQPIKDIENNDVVMFRNRPISIRDVQAFYNERNRQRKQISQMNIIKSKRAKKNCQGCIQQIQTDKPCLYFDYMDNKSDSESTDDLLDHNPFKNKFGSYLDRYGLNNFNPNKYKPPYSKKITQKQYQITPQSVFIQKPSFRFHSNYNTQFSPSSSDGQNFTSEKRSKRVSVKSIPEFSDQINNQNRQICSQIPFLQTKPSKNNPLIVNTQEEDRQQVDHLKAELEAEQLKQKIEQQKIDWELQKQLKNTESEVVKQLLAEKQNLASKLHLTKTREEFQLLKHKLHLNQQLIDFLLDGCGGKKRISTNITPQTNTNLTQSTNKSLHRSGIVDGSSRVDPDINIGVDAAVSDEEEDIRGDDLVTTGKLQKSKRQQNYENPGKPWIYPGTQPMSRSGVQPEKLTKSSPSEISQKSSSFSVENITDTDFSEEAVLANPIMYIKDQRKYFAECFHLFHVQQPKSVLVAPFKLKTQEFSYRTAQIIPHVTFRKVIFKFQQLAFLQTQLDKLENQLERNVFWSALCYITLFPDKFLRQKKIANKINKVTIQIPCSLTYKPKGALVKLYADVNQLYFCGIIGIPYINKQPVVSKFQKIKKVDEFDFEVEFLPENNKKLVQALEHALVKIALLL